MTDPRTPADHDADEARTEAAYQRWGAGNWDVRDHRPSKAECDRDAWECGDRR